MKYVFNIALAIAAIAFTSSIALAADKPKPLSDIPPAPSKVGTPSIASTGNDTTTPIELSNPATAIDNAISSPQKNAAEAAGQVRDMEPAAAADPAIEQAQETYKKPATKTKKAASKHHKKSHKATKTKKSAHKTKAKTHSGTNKH